jgi:hypothetical protein
MDDEDVERILASMERKYGADNMEFASKYGRFRQILVRDYIYGDLQTREKKKEEGKRTTFTWKQYEPLKKGIQKKYPTESDEEI